MDNEGYFRNSRCLRRISGDFRTSSERTGYQNAHFQEDHAGITPSEAAESSQDETFDAYSNTCSAARVRLMTFPDDQHRDDNKTDFFPQSSLFDYLVSHIMPCFSSGQISIWSAAFYG
jgi:hypothetical protein